MKRNYLLGLLLFFFQGGFAQQTFNSAGTNAVSGNFSLDWSVGELSLVSTVQNGNLVFTQGLLQGNIIVFVTTPSSIADGEIKILPNPTPGMLYLQTGFLKPGKLSVIIYNAAGQLLSQSQEQLNGFTTKSIDMSAYAAGTYMLQVSFRDVTGNERKRTYKIIKL
ncbi:MAG TPA: T9SS type A sorting domain-containing protein [Chitinophagaceae bacterium]|jgi:hypothetical protein|nr:T9SS type A sorting domain-containing protein [Chitinophagaceae bacterium]